MRPTRPSFALLLWVLGVFFLKEASGENAATAPPVTSTIEATVRRLTEKSTLAGKVRPLLGRFILTRKQAEHILQGINSVVKPGDVAIIVLFGWVSLPLIEFPLQKSRSRLVRSFRHSTVYVLFDHIAQAARIALLVYVTDIIKIISRGLGFQSPIKGDHAVAEIAYTIWIANRMSALKKYLLCRSLRLPTDTDLDGRPQVVDRLADAAIYFVMLFCLFEILNFEMGLTAKGFLAFGGVGTLAATLASQDLVKQILQGLMLASSDRLYEGDYVLFGNGVKGRVERLGWMETVLRGQDENTLSVPNSDLARQQISNLSRVMRCQVKQVLKLKNASPEQIPQLLLDIKIEIRKACPALITDGQRPFRVHWTDIVGDSLEVTVNTYYNIRPLGDLYWDNRQRVLEAIMRAVQKNDMKLA